MARKKQLVIPHTTKNLPTSTITSSGTEIQYLQALFSVLLVHFRVVQMNFELHAITSTCLPLLKHVT